jgi:hypothetical protein
MRQSKVALCVGAAVAVVALAYAADYGLYLCAQCPPLMDPISVMNFVGVFVNPNVGAWRANDTVSICNGSACTMYLTPSPTASTWSPVGQYPDPQIGYKGTGEPIGSGPGGGDNPIGDPGEGEHGGVESCSSCHD